MARQAAAGSHRALQAAGRLVHLLLMNRQSQWRFFGRKSWDVVCLLIFTSLWLLCGVDCRGAGPKEETSWELARHSRQEAVEA